MLVEDLKHGQVAAFPNLFARLGQKFEDFVVPTTVNPGQSRQDWMISSKILKTPEHGECQVFRKPS